MLENINFVNIYFAICLIAWVISVIAFVVIYSIKPLRKWFMKKYWKLVMSFSSEFLETIPEDKEKDNEDENL